MSESDFTRLLSILREKWSAAGILYGRGASDADMAAFEARHGVCLPPDLREYFATVNGTMVGAYGMQDDDLLGFWHLDEVRPFAEILADNGPPSSEAARTFAIADHSIWVYGFGIQLSATPDAPTPIVVDIRAPYHQVAHSFAAFLEGYLGNDERVIYPDP